MPPRQGHERRPSGEVFVATGTGMFDRPTGQRRKRPRNPDNSTTHVTWRIHRTQGSSVDAMRFRMTNTPFGLTPNS